MRDGTLLPLYQSLAAATDSHRAAADELAQAVEHADKLEPALRRDLELRVARLYLEHCQDPAAADAALARALLLDAGHVPTLLLRGRAAAPSAGSGPSTRRWCASAAETPHNLDYLREAAALALAPPGRRGAGLDGRSERLWERGRAA